MFIARQNLVLISVRIALLLRTLPLVGPAANSIAAAAAATVAAGAAVAADGDGDGARCPRPPGTGPPPLSTVAATLADNCRDHICLKINANGELSGANTDSKQQIALSPERKGLFTTTTKLH